MNAIVITSIHQPTHAIREFVNSFPEWRVIVVGDKKTPKNWELPGVDFLSLDRQFQLFPELCSWMPLNTYKRKIFGYLYAARLGAEYVLESDDDNVPYDEASLTVDGLIKTDKARIFRRSGGGGWVNVYADIFGEKHIWPRGFPLEEINNHDKLISNERKIDWGVIQSMADLDADVDAIYRLTNNRGVMFKERPYLAALALGNQCPFNSQATLWRRESLPATFLPLGVDDRVTDILRSYMATASFWNVGKVVAFCSAMVFQQRNEHNLLEDFNAEIPLYQNANRWMNLCLQSVEGDDLIQSFSSCIDRFADDGLISITSKIAYRLFCQELGK